MESNSSAVAPGTSTGPLSRRIWALARVVFGVAVLAALYHFGDLNLAALAPLRRAPWTLAAAGALILLTLPLAALRWAIALRALSIVLPFIPLFRIVCISTFVSQLLFGPTSADAVRAIYAWRMLRRGAGRIAVSVLVDRAMGLFALFILAISMMVLRWDRVREVPKLMFLALSLVACLVAALAASTILLAAPSLLSLNIPKLPHYPRITRFLAQVRDVLMAFRHRPGALLALLCLSLMIQGFALLAFLIIARSLRIGDVTLLDVSVAAPLAMIANVLPFTPGGLGVGEAAFDQLCRWLAPTIGVAPYASIFFSVRAISMVTLIPGPISFAMHRSETAPTEV
jgi:glycosyltransferase 2 family protein